MSDELYTRRSVKQVAQIIFDSSIRTGVNILKIAENLTSAYLLKSAVHHNNSAEEYIFEGLHRAIEHGIKSVEGCAMVKNTFQYDWLLGGDRLSLKNISEVVEVVDGLRYLRFCYTLGGVKYPMVAIPSEDKSRLFVMVAENERI